MDVELLLECISENTFLETKKFLGKFETIKVLFETIKYW